jgi:hypothetical protein
MGDPALTDAGSGISPRLITVPDNVRDSGKDVLLTSVLFSLQAVKKNKTTAIKNSCLVMVFKFLQVIILNDYRENYSPAQI